MSVTGLSVRSSGFNIAAPGANTNILAANITPQYGGAFRVTVGVSTASVFDVLVTDGSTTHVLSLNDGTTLDANELYTFTFGVNPDLAYNFRVKTNSVIEVLQVDEVSGGVI